MISGSKSRSWGSEPWSASGTKEVPFSYSGPITHDTPIRQLGLTVSITTIAVLSALGVETVGQLQKVTRRAVIRKKGVGPKSWQEIAGCQSALKRKLSSESSGGKAECHERVNIEVKSRSGEGGHFNKTDISNYLISQDQVEIEGKPVLDSLSFELLVRSFLKEALPNPRDFKIASTRLGLNGDMIPTQEDLANELGISRGRVSQIEPEIFSEKLPKRSKMLESFWEEVRDALVSGGGIRSLEDLSEVLRRRYSWNESPQVQLLCDLLKLSSKWSVTDVDEPVILHKYPCVKCKTPLRALKSYFEEASIDEINILDAGYRVACVCEDICQKSIIPQAFSEEFISNTAYQAGLKLNEGKIITLRKYRLCYGDSLRDVVRATLEIIGEPITYAALASFIRKQNVRYFEVTDRQVHNCLTSHPKGYKSYGKGIFGLTEWTKTHQKTCSEAIIELLEHSQEPQTESSITEWLVGDGKYLEANVVEVLNSHPSIVKLDDNLYTLRENIREPKKEWDKDVDEVEETSEEDLVFAFDGNDDLELSFTVDDEFDEGAVSAFHEFQTKYSSRDGLNCESFDEGDEDTEWSFEQNIGAENGSWDNLVSIITENLNRSYKPVFLLSLLDSPLIEGEFHFGEVAQNFIDFYCKRLLSKQIVEKEDSEVIGVLSMIPNRRLKRVKQILLKKPLAIFSLHGFLTVKKEWLCPTSHLTVILENQDLIQQLHNIAKLAIESYYTKLEF